MSAHRTAILAAMVAATMSAPASAEVFPTLYEDVTVLEVDVVPAVVPVQTASVVGFDAFLKGFQDPRDEDARKRPPVRNS